MLSLWLRLGTYMDFRTAINIPPAPFQIDHNMHLLMVGSCFTTQMGERLRLHKFNVHTNPFGISYNPVSMANAIWPQSDFSPSTFFEHEGIWRHWDLHSELAAITQEAAAEQARLATESTKIFAEKADVLLLTFGTADVHFLLENDQIVANNHKMPAKLFGQKRLGVQEVASCTAQLVQRLRQTRPMLKVVLTVSPVRHWRSGAVANQRSKATLLLACETLCAQLPGTYYFPAYELMMDDLRDYRFYANDMLHPSETAVAYIWEQFKRAFFTPDTVALGQRIHSVVQAAAHRPFNPDTAQHRNFVAQQLKAIAVLEQEFPMLDFEAERRVFQK
jgi:hypothetical protein